MDDWFGTYQNFLLATIIMGIFGWIYPHALYFKRFGLVLATPISLVLSFVALFLTASFVALILQAVLDPRILERASEMPLGFLEYVAGNGAELLSIGLIVMPISLLLKVFSIYRSRRK